MRHLFVPVLISIFELAALGQTTAGNSSVSGIVVDPSEAPVGAARVVLRDQIRGQVRTTETNAAGSYYFPAVLTGQYELLVTKDGFDPYNVQQIQITVGQAARFDVRLHIGTVSSTVNVEAGGAGVQLIDTSNQIGTVMDHERVENLPLNGRSYLQLGVLSGGVSTPRNGSDVVSGGMGRSDRSIQINGNFQSETGYSVNGISVRGMRVGESALSVSVAAIDEFKIHMSFFMPDLGPNPGIVNVVTKSGTNQYHGETYEYFRNTVFDARSFFSPNAEQLNRNQFGFVVGGPVRLPKLINGRDHMWFTANYEGDRQISRNTSSTYAATERMMNGDFSRAGAIVYDPGTYDPSTGTRTPFAGNLIPSSRINPVTAKLLQYYRAGSSESSSINLYGNPGTRIIDNQAGGRLDAALSPRQNLSGSFFWQDSPVTVEGLMPLTGSTPVSSANVFALQHTVTFSPSLVGVGRIGFSRTILTETGEAAKLGDLLTGLGITGTPDTHGIPGISISGYAGMGRAKGTNGDINNNYQADYGVIWNHGRALVQAGSGLRYHRIRLQNANSNALGTLSFQKTYTAQLTAAGTTVSNTGNAFADYLLGYPTTGSVLGLPPYNYRYWEVYPYVQTTYRIAPTLTLNAGLSWFHNTIPSPQSTAANIPHMLDLQTGLLRYAALGEIDPKVLKPQYNTWTPRVGLSWQPTSKTVIRSGAGVYYGESFLFETQFAMNAPPYTNTRTFANSNPAPTYVLGSNIFPAGDVPVVTSEYARNLASGYSPFAMNPNGKLPTIVQWNFSIQQSLTPNTLAEITYMGNEGHHLQNRYDIDQCRPANGMPCVYSARPYPRYASVLYSSNDGNSNYNSLLLKFQRRLKGGASVFGDYISSKSINDSWEGSGATASQISFCRSCDRALSSINVPHRLVGSFVVPVPVGRGKRLLTDATPLANAVVGDWSVSGIVTFSSGNPFTVGATNATASVFSDFRANRSCSGQSDDLSSNLRGNGMRYFDTSCFSQPASGYFGTSGRDILTGPGLNNFDLSAQKAVRFSERLRMDLRGEFFNALNHAQFYNPASGVADANFGKITSARPARLIQLGAKLVF